MALASVIGVGLLAGCSGGSGTAKGSSGSSGTSDLTAWRQSLPEDDGDSSSANEPFSTSGPKILPSATATAGSRARTPGRTTSTPGVTLVAAPAAVRQQFARVPATVAGVYRLSGIQVVRQGGQDVAAVAGYRVQQASPSQIFQTQLVNQVLTGAAGTGVTTRTVTVSGRTVLLGVGPGAVAGWYDRGSVHLLLGSPGTDLRALVAALIASGRLS